MAPPWGRDRRINNSDNLTFGLSPTLISNAYHGYNVLASIAGVAETNDGHTGLNFCDWKSKLMGTCIESSMVRNVFNANYSTTKCGSPNADTFACAINGITKALTTMRNAGLTANGTDIREEFLVRGTALGAATFIRIQ